MYLDIYYSDWKLKKMVFNWIMYLNVYICKKNTLLEQN